MKVLALVVLTTLSGCGSQNGANGIGIQGPAGNDGKNGESLVYTQIPATIEQCAAGGTVFLMALDSEGTGTYSATDKNQQSMVVCNGAQGQQGVQGQQGLPSAFAPVTPISPCGISSSPYKEVLLCLADGEVLSSFSENLSGQDTRLAFLTAGTFEDTDESGCIFTVTIEKNKTIITWDAGFNSYASWNAQTAICAKQL